VRDIFCAVPFLLNLSFVTCFQLLEKFIEEFFDQNPISQLGIMMMYNKRAEKISELSGK
jgi:Ssl1-like